MNTKSERISRALLSLTGLSVGDAFGETFFVHSAVVEGLIADRALATTPWRWTDDTLMASSLVENLRKHDSVEEVTLTQDFVKQYDPGRGYGPTIGMAFRQIRADAIAPGEIFPYLFDGQGSFGNGAAMRVAPLGAYFADAEMGKIVEEARRSAAVTHTHPEGIAGAIAVAIAAALAWQSRGQTPSRIDFLDAVIPYVPDGITKEKIKHARNFELNVSTRFAAEVLGTGHQVSAQDTVPFALFCAGTYLKDYGEALWQTVSGLGDRDTTCAIVGGIVALHTGASGIPGEWLAAREPLPALVDSI